MREQHGVEYTSALNTLLPVVVDAQSAAVQGKSVSKDTFAKALQVMAAADAKYGSDFGTKTRWSNLRTRIEALPALGAGDPDGAFRSYGEVTDLTLALYRRVAQASGLRSEPDGAISYLQDAALEEIPSAIVWSGRFQDQAVIAATLPAAQNAAQQDALNEALTSMAVSRQIAGQSGSDVAADMAGAVDASASGTFGAALLQDLDAFQRGIEALAPPGKTTLTDRPAPASVRTQRASMQSAAVALNPVLLDELHSQVDSLKSSDDEKRILLAVLVVIAILAAFGSAAVARLPRRRRAADAPPRRNGNGGAHYRYPEGTDQLNAERLPSDPGAWRDTRRERTGVPR